MQDPAGAVRLLCPRDGVRLGLTRVRGACWAVRARACRWAWAREAKRAGLGVEGHRGRVAAVSCVGGVGFASFSCDPAGSATASKTRWPVEATWGLYRACRGAVPQLHGRFAGLAVINSDDDRIQHRCCEGRGLCPVSGGQDRRARARGLLPDADRRAHTGPRPLDRLPGHARPSWDRGQHS
jgi:hypothetical protein